MRKTPIDPSEIRKGDLIRYEYADNETDGRADEYRATHDGHNWVDSDTGRFYLLDRPKPPVDLPTEPTLGWLHFSTGAAPCLDRWWTEGGQYAHRRVEGRTKSVPAAGVTAFTPATAVPTEALERFRHIRETRTLTTADVDAFLAAVDKAANA